VSKSIATAAATALQHAEAHMEMRSLFVESASEAEDQSSFNRMNGCAQRQEAHAKAYIAEACQSGYFV
jgi:Tfp pilus assembly protein PilX